MAIRIVRLGTPRLPGEGLRIGTVRRPPRGVPKAEFAARNYYDVWLPEVAPSEQLVKQAQQASEARAWETFVKRYRREMSQPAASRLLDLLAALSHSTDLSVGCYCEDEGRCHRSVLRELLAERGAQLGAQPAPAADWEAERAALLEQLAAAKQKLEVLEKDRKWWQDNAIRRSKRAAARKAGKPRGSGES